MKSQVVLQNESEKIVWTPLFKVTNSLNPRNEKEAARVIWEEGQSSSVMRMPGSNLASFSKSGFNNFWELASMERKPNYSWRDKPASCLNIASFVHLSMC